MSCSEKVRQRRLGSGPKTKMMSPPAPATCHIPTVGHTMLRTPPSFKRTCGRMVAKSVNASGSISASGCARQPSIKLRTALDAASAASFQPVKAVTITGCFRDGLDNQRTWSSVDIWLKRYLRIRTTFESITRIPNLNNDQTDSATRVNTEIAPSLWITRKPCNSLRSICHKRPLCPCPP